MLYTNSGACKDLGKAKEKPIENKITFMDFLKDWILMTHIESYNDVRK